MAATSGRVLVVDDSEVIRQLIRVNLELEGFEVVTAADGAECLEVVRRVAPDVVTLDVVMPRLDGLRTAARLRAARDTAHLPIAIVSACTPADLERGESVGVDGYLAKPFDPAELVALVRRLRAGALTGRRFAYDFGSPGQASGQTSGHVSGQASGWTPGDSAQSEQAQELVRPDEPRP
ncbi:response regulator [Kitasatospora sp. NA04385]|uniref:response regulator n=1 Tax=Kitasatospora sp. NA04385 TaxID=2742135 RepID=UPI00158FFB84|nr:response regulator [Kitasatospora sp. NA04385]QKW21546.1 response regulator [Kitasatospora sp. NA04385]